MKLLFCLLMLSSTAQAQWRLLKVDKLSMEYAKLYENRQPYANYLSGRDTSGDERWTATTAVNFDLALIKFGDYGWYWNNHVHGETTNNQFRTVGWQFRTGVKLDDTFDIFYKHHSQHVLEESSEYPFPLRDEVGIEIIFYKNREAL